MANGTIAFDTLQTSGQITGTAKSLDTDYVVNGSAKAKALHRDQVLQSGSLNHTSLTDNGTGDFTHNFTSSFANTIYSISAHCHYTASGTTSGIFYNGHAGVERTASAIEMESYYMDNTNARTKSDLDDCDLICFGDLA